MSIKKYLWLLIPPLLVQLYHRLRPQTPWEGMYAHFREVEVEGGGLAGDLYADMVESKTREVAEQLAKSGTVPIPLKGDKSLFPLLVAVISTKSNNKNSIKILDFGGGGGIDYFYLKSALPQIDNLEFHIVESDKVCQRGHVIFQADPHVFYYTDLPEHIENFDVIHVDSVLQYIEDYSLLLRNLCSYKPEYFLFVRLSAGDIPTYVTKQKNLSGVCCPYQFVNLGDFISTMNQLGYTLAFKSSGDTEYNQDNFPRAYRMGRSCNLLFIRAQA